MSKELFDAYRARDALYEKRINRLTRMIFWTDVITATLIAALIIMLIVAYSLT